MPKNGGKRRRGLWRWTRNTARFHRLLVKGGAKTQMPPSQAGRSTWLLYCWGGTRGTVADLEGRLARDGFVPTVPHLGGLFGLINTGAIDESARRLKEEIELSLSDQHESRIAIIGHSIGGLIGRYYVSLLGGDRSVHTLIMLGTPHRGNSLAHLIHATPLGWLSHGLRQLSPKSEIIAALAKAPIPSSVYCANIFSSGDIFAPPTSAAVPEAGDMPHIVDVPLAGIGHLELVTDAGVYGVIKAHLDIGLQMSRGKEPGERSESAEG